MMVMLVEVVTMVLGVVMVVFVVGINNMVAV